MLHGTGSAVIDARAPGLSQLARRMGLHHDSARVPARQILITRYRQVTENVRDTYERVLGL